MVAFILIRSVSSLMDVNLYYFLIRHKSVVQNRLIFASAVNLCFISTLFTSTSLSTGNKLRMLVLQQHCWSTSRRVQRYKNSHKLMHYPIFISYFLAQRLMLRYDRYRLLLPRSLYSLHIPSPSTAGSLLISSLVAYQYGRGRDEKELGSQL